MSCAWCIGECMVELRGAGDGLLRQSFAGDSYNTAVYLKRSAPEISVHYITATGSDPMSRAMRVAWAGEGIEDDLAFIVPDRTPGLYMIELDAAGERRFHYWRGESAARRWLVELRRAGIDTLFGADLVYLSGISLAILTPDEQRDALVMLGDLRGKVGKIAFDPNYRPALWPSREAAAVMVREAAARCDIFLPSSEDMEALFPHEAFAPPGLEVAMTAGGARCQVDGSWVQGELASTVVDTSGAGDSFNGAYLAARLRGAPPYEAARVALSLAAKVVGQPGAIIPK